MSVISQLFGGVFGNNNQGTQQPQQNQQANQPAVPGNFPQQNQMPANPTNPTVPLDSSNPTATTQVTQAAPEGLDKFKDMWTIPADQLPKPPESAFAGVTPEALQQVAGKTDFSKVVTPELMSKISAGGEEAAAAMITAINLVAQQTYAQSAGASMKLIETALGKQREQFQAELPNIIKQQTVTESLRNSNPIFNHPAAAPMLDTLQKQIQLKNPTATADQIKRQAEEYLISFAGAANPVKATDVNSQSQNGNKTDWSDFF